ncbi:hypothetical protein NOCD_14675 [Nocardioides cavernae]|uniref:hypothetical protein n=1 Tax=Nocardioides TaxID=1839 RepID=UPI0012E3336F|nr:MULTISPECIES: hypothetical protein [Nocardioides]MCK9824727.1 hypothetical protein [Nocardioides cavernae]
MIDDAEQRRRSGERASAVAPTPAPAREPDASSTDESPTAPAAADDHAPDDASGETERIVGDATSEEPSEAVNGDESADKPSRPSRADELDGADGLLQPDKLDDAIKWAAAGFTALAAVLAFLGYKEGVLDQALRIYPAASIAVLVLLGIGVVGALFARAVDPRARFLVWSLLALLLLMLFSASLFLPDIGDLSRGAPLIDKPSGFALGQLYKPLGLALVVLFLIAAVVSAALWESHSRRAMLVAALGLASAVGAAWLLAPREINPLTGVAGDFDTARLAAYVLTFVLLAGLLLLTVAAFAQRTTFSLMAGLTILAVASTALGLYGATKVAVEAKSIRSLPQVEADVENNEGTSTVTIAVTGSRVRGLQVVVGINGLRRGSMPRTMDDPTVPADEEGTPIWSGLVLPSALDEINRKVRVDVHPDRWDLLTVYYCLTTKDAGLDCASEKPVKVATFATPAAAKEIAQVTATLEEAADGKVKAHFSASEVAPGVLTRLELCRQRTDKHVSHVLDVSLAPDAQGNVSWETTVPAGGKGDRLLLRHTTCVPGMPCTTEWRTLSTFVNEARAEETAAPSG